MTDQDLDATRLPPLALNAEGASAFDPYIFALLHHDVPLFLQSNIESVSCPLPVPFQYRIMKLITERIVSLDPSVAELSRTLFFSGHGNNADHFLDVSSESNLVDPGHAEVEYTGKPCGKMFKAGDMIYRCATCAYDGTCVMCSVCFHSTDHTGHDTSFHVSSSGGGCCDCGDSEAWRIDLGCPYHYPNPEYSAGPAGADPNTHSQNAITPLPKELVGAMRAVLASIIDYIIDSFKDSTTHSEMDLEAIKNAHRDEIEMVERSLQTAHPMEAPTYACILWNDEYHSFQDVIQVTEAALHIDEAAAQAIAEAVDAYGRHIVRTSPDISSLITAGTLMARIKLGVTIRSVCKTVREEISAIILMWLKLMLQRLPSAPQRIGQVQYESIKAVFIQVFCEELLKKPMRNLSPFKGRVHDLPADIGNVVRQASPADDSSVEASDALILMPITSQRIDHFFQLDSLLWKKVRLVLRELYISTFVVSGEDTKRQFGVLFARNYLRLASLYLLNDREFDISIMNLSVQLFTVPTLSQHLLANTKFYKTLISILKACCLNEIVGSPQDGQFIDFVNACSQTYLPYYPRLPCEKELSDNRRMWHIYHDIKYLISSAGAKEIFRRQSSDLECSLDLYTVWQGLNPQSRQTLRHVLYESSAWITAFNMSAQSHIQTKLAAQCFEPIPTQSMRDNFRCLLDAIIRTIGRVASWTLFDHQVFLEQQASALRDERITHGFHHVSLKGLPISAHVPYFLVEQFPVSLHHPLHWFLSFLFKHLGPCLQQISSEEEASWMPCSRTEIWKRVFQIAAIQLNPEHLVPQSGNHPPSSQSPGLQEIYPKTNPQSLLHTLADQKRLLLLVDYSIRSTVFITQIRANMWVRNGANSMFPQAIHYGSDLLRECYDMDLFLIQIGSLLLEPSVFVLNILDRFRILRWLNQYGTYPDLRDLQTATIPESVFNEPQESLIRLIAEELVFFFITLVSERSLASNLDLRSQAERELIHLLATNPNGLPYSKITKKTPDRFLSIHETIPSVRFDDILSSLARFTYPMSVEDKGKYTLKEEHYQQVDPYYWHYTRNQRDSIAEVLKHVHKSQMDRVGATSGSAQVYGGSGRLTYCVDELSLPVLRKLDPSSGLARLGDFVHDPIFVEMLRVMLLKYTIESRRNQSIKPSDTIVNELIHMALIAVMMETESGPRGFSKHASGESSQDSDRSTGLLNGDSLLGLLLFLIEDGALEDQLSRIKFIVSSVAAMEGNISGRALVDKWLEELAQKELEASRLRLAASAGADPGVGLGGHPGAASGQSEQNLSSANASTAGGSEVPLSEAEKKRLAAKARQAALLEQMAKQQQSFVEMNRADYDDGDDDGSDDGNGDDAMSADAEPRIDRVAMLEGDHYHTREYKFPTGNCIVCQEKTKPDGPLYGLLGFIQPSRILRHVDFHQTSTITQALDMPASLDTPQRRHIEPDGAPQRPSSAGVGAADVKRQGKRPMHADRRPAIKNVAPPRSTFGMHSTTCGHLMHSTCFMAYQHSISQRYADEILSARNLPENLAHKEFLCPLCQSLGNCFLPVIWADRKEHILEREASTPGHTAPGSLDAEMRLWWDSRLSPFVAAVDTLDEVAQVTPQTADPMEVDETSAELLQPEAESGPSTDVPVRLGIDTIMELVDPRGEFQRGNGADADAVIERFFGSLNRIGGRAARDTDEDGTEDLDLLEDTIPVGETGITISYRLDEDEDDEGDDDDDREDTHSIVVHRAPTTASESCRIFEMWLTNPVKSVYLGVDPGYNGDSMELNELDLLWELFSYSIAALEIGSRGAPRKAASSPGSATASTTVPEGEGVGVLQTLTANQTALLSVLSTSILAYTDALTKVRNVSRLKQMGRDLVRSLFYGIAVSSDAPSDANGHQLLPVLMEDSFSTLVEISMAAVPLAELGTEEDVFNWVRTFWIMEVTKCAIAVIESVGLRDEPWIRDEKIARVVSDLQDPSVQPGASADGDGAAQFIDWIMTTMAVSSEAVAKVRATLDGALLIRFCKSFGLPFLRKSTILLAARFGLSPSSTYHDNSPGLCEYERLLKYLRLPSVEQVLSPHFTDEDSFLSKLIKGWCLHLTHYREQKAKGAALAGGLETPPQLGTPPTSHRAGAYARPSTSASSSVMEATETSSRRSLTASSAESLIVLNNPCVFELYPLPNSVFELLSESYTVICPNCKTIPSDPALCLLCGSVVCSQTYCCHKNGKGECNRHMEVCSGQIGIYFSIKKCAILLLHNGTKGALLPSPYLNSHGEADMNMTIGRPQYLNQRRYDEIRKLWLTHQVPAMIARRIEATYDTNRWEML